MWKYGDAFSKDDVVKALEYTESLFEQYGAVPTDLNAENRKRLGQRVTYFYDNSYFRLDVIYWDNKPSIVFQGMDDIELAKVGVMEDGDNFPFNLSPGKIEKEVRYLFEIEPYPLDHYVNYYDSNPQNRTDTMTILNLCNKINLRSEIKNRVIAFSLGFDFSTVDKQLKEFRVYEKMAEARQELQKMLGEDGDNIKILACMLKASADAHEVYEEKGIGNDIYFSTMKCYTRFIDETYKITGRLYFDRFWWTPRQAGCHLFRIGELEYEMKPVDGSTVIEMHIPSDADLSPSAVDRSLSDARSFFKTHYPELSNAEYRCHSWLLDGQLKGMLGDNSNILAFQRRFEIFNEGEADTEFIEWLYNTRTDDHSALPENTSLQRNMKKHLLSGGVCRNAYGRLKH